MTKRGNFRAGNHVVYPAHGVGRVLAVEDQTISGYELEMLVIEFEKEKMLLRIPTAKVQTAGLRTLSTKKEMQNALRTLKGRVRIKRTMWSRRAQEYEAKINSGDPILIAEVVRDLHRNADQPDQSYSERQIYQAALERLSRELAVVEKIDEDKAVKRVELVLEAA
ncbi:MAG: CarD family transcriptional regulator [Alphaproteobacteria bacterium]|nr:CarD family transcriptional regulator [Alphaproteobacteria bacterium]